MSDADKKPREWFISPAFCDGAGFQQTDDRIYTADYELWPGWKVENSHLIHVVERSTLDAALAEIERLKLNALTLVGIPLVSGLSDTVLDGMKLLYERDNANETIKARDAEIERLKIAQARFALKTGETIGARDAEIAALKEEEAKTWKFLFNSGQSMNKGIKNLEVWSANDKLTAASEMIETLAAALMTNNQGNADDALEKYAKWKGQG